MSKLNFQQRVEGHRVEPPSNRDLEQKLTYQQLLNLNHDLSKQNKQLKNIAGRLGQELRNLHTQFDVRPRDQNNQLYNAIGTHPILHQYQLTLIPLLDAYQAKIQQFQSGYETVNEEFINLEKKYIQVSSQNQRLRTQLTDKIKQLVEVYQSGSSEKLGADFSQIILAQVNEKQKFLTEENSKLQRDFQKYKSESDKLSKQLTESKRKEQEISSKHRQLEINHRQAEGQVRSLKDQIFNSQMRINELESDKKKLDNDIQRAMSQIAQVNKEKEGLFKNYDTIKRNYERDVSLVQQAETYKTQTWSRPALEETKQQVGDDSHKKLVKLQKDFDVVSRERNKLNEEIQNKQATIKELNDRISQIKKKLDTVENEKRSVQMSEAKNKKLLEQFTQKSKFDVEKLKKYHDDEIKKLEDDYYSRIEEKQRKIAQVQQKYDKVKLEKDTFEQQNILFSTLAKQNIKGTKNKDSEREIKKLQQKLNINEELFKEQLHIIENDNTYLKKQSENFKNQGKQKSEELRKARQQLEKTKAQLVESEEKHLIIIEEIKRVKFEYEGSLKDKERIFEQKIKQIKTVLDQSQRRRKNQREKVAEASRQYKRVLEQMRSTYEERIRVIEGQINYKGKGA